jgi:hypothetical protein
MPQYPRITSTTFVFFFEPHISPRFRRPGDYLKPGEDEIEGLKRRLDDRLAPPTDSRQFNASHGVGNEWEIGDCLAQWWRPNFETFMVRLRSSIKHHHASHARPESDVLRSTRSFPHTSQSRKNAKSCSWYRCQSEVRELSTFPRRLR